MRNIYVIDDYCLKNDELYFSLNESHSKIQIQPAGQMLTDSDRLAFIYVVDDGDGYSYLQFPQTLWSALVAILKTKKDPRLIVNGETILLHNFANELETLVFNIEGNGNYGEEFVQAVEEAFRDILNNR